MITVIVFLVLFVAAFTITFFIALWRVCQDDNAVIQHERERSPE